MKPLKPNATRNHPAIQSILIGLVSSAAILSGCASKPIPSEQFAISKTAIDSATAAGADQYSPLEIKSAREKLTSAERAVHEKNYEVASALAEESTVDAKLAEAKSASEKSKRSVEEIDKNLRTLLDETNRNQQMTQPGGASQPR